MTQATTEPTPEPTPTPTRSFGKTSNLPLVKKLEARIEALEQLAGVDKTACKALKAMPKKLTATNTKLDTMSKRLDAMIDNYNTMLTELDREPLETSE